MLESVKTVFGVVRDNWREECSLKEKLAIIIALIAGPTIGALFVAGWYADGGCAIHSTGALLMYGLGGLVMTVVFAVFVCLVVIGFLYMPSGLRAAVEGIQDWNAGRRRQRQFNIKHGCETSFLDWDRVKWHVIFWPVLLAVIAGLSLTLGWIVWHIVC